MTIVEARDRLINEGYKLENHTEPDELYLYKRMIGSSECQCNGRSPNLGVTLYQFGEHTSMKMNIRAESINGQWVDVGYYSMPFDEVEEIKTYEFVITKMWEAAN